MNIQLSDGKEITMVRMCHESDIFLGRDEETNTEYFLETYHAPPPTSEEIEQVEVQGIPGEIIPLSPTAYEVERRRQTTQALQHPQE